MTAHASPVVSVVVATYNRSASLRRLLGQLAAQTVPAGSLEVVIVDDGSREPVAPVIDATALPYTLRVVRQANSGAAAARHRGVVEATGRILVILDDDMQLPPHFLSAHLAQHQEGPGAVVIGRIRRDAALPLPLHERFHASLLDRFAENVRTGRLQPQGTDLFTGNVSMRRADYLAVGGFDLSLRRSEDVELGVRLQKAGLRFLFSEEAYTVHSSDHASQPAWLETALLYGVYDSRIARTHHESFINPWRHLYDANPLSRPFLLISVTAPGLARYLVRFGTAVSNAMDRVGQERAAIAGITVVYTMQYYRGVRREAGSWRAARAALNSYVAERRASAAPLQPSVAR
jgi:GT2 family glycosyltransferase